MSNRFFIILASVFLLFVGTMLGRTYEFHKLNNDTIKLQKDYQQLANEFDEINANYQNLLYMVYEQYPDFVQDVLMETDDWFLLRQYNNDFHILYQNMSINDTLDMYYKSDADRQEGADL